MSSPSNLPTPAYLAISVRSSTGDRTAGTVRNPRKKDRARERDEIEPSWDVPGKSITPHLDLGLSHAPAVLGRLSQSQAHLAVGGARGLAAASPYSHSQSGAESFVNPDQSNNSASALVKSTQPSSSTGGPADQQRHLRRPATINPGPGPCQSPMDPMARVNTSHDAGAD